ncbi:MAG: hypothetical protein HQ461_15980 [Deltaproteobacteria bacterium]|nr:hypothetical protein [Deltaproteobacteria bacterium]
MPAWFTFLDVIAFAAPSKERNWVVRHAVRHPAKQGVARAIALRRKAK